MRARRWMARGLLAGAGGALALGLAAMLGTWLGAPWLEHRFAQWATVLASLALVVHPARAEWLARFEARVERLPRWAGVAAVLLGVTCLVGFKFAQHLGLRTTTIDLTLYESVVAALLRGDGFFSPWLGRSFLSEHASLVLLAWVPFYAAWQGPEALLLAHALGTGAAVVPLVALARQEGLSRLEAWLLGAAFLLNPLLWRAFVFDVHPELLLPLGVVTMTWAAVARRWWPFFFAGVASLLVKEDAALVVAPVCGWLVVRGLGPRWRLLSMAGLSLGWMLFALRVVLPHAGAEVSHFLGERYGHLGATYGEVLVNVLQHPSWWVEWLTGRPAREFFAALGLTPVLQPVATLMSLPQLFLNRATLYPAQSALTVHYGLPAFTVLLAAVPAAALVAKRRVGSWGAVVVVLSLAWPTTRQVTPAPWPWPRDTDAPARAALSRVDVAGGACAQWTLPPHVPAAARQALQLMPECQAPRVFLFSPAGTGDPDVRARDFALGRAALAGEYGATFASPSLVVLERGAKGPLDAEALRLLTE